MKYEKINVLVKFNYQRVMGLIVYHFLILVYQYIQSILINFIILERIIDFQNLYSFI